MLVLVAFAANRSSTHLPLAVLTNARPPPLMLRAPGALPSSGEVSPALSIANASPGLSQNAVRIAAFAADPVQVQDGTSGRACGSGFAATTGPEISLSTVPVEINAQLPEDRAALTPAGCFMPAAVVGAGEIDDAVRAQ